MIFYIFKSCHSVICTNCSPWRVSMYYPSQSAAIRFYHSHTHSVKIIFLNVGLCHCWWELPFFLSQSFICLPSVCLSICLFLSLSSSLSLAQTLPPTWGIVKLKTMNVITTATEFREIRNSLGACLLMTCEEMKLRQGQKGCEGCGWTRRKGRRWNEKERVGENVLQHVS